MSTYKAIRDIAELITPTGVPDADDVTSLTGMLDKVMRNTSLPASTVPHINTVPGIENKDFSGWLNAFSNLTTVANGLLDGELLQWDRSAVNLSIGSLSADDDVAGGPGARVVLVEYIDENGDAQEIGVTLDGTNESPTGIMAQCVNGMTVVSTGGTSNRNHCNTGIIYAGVGSLSGGVWTVGKPDIIYSVINAGYSLSSCCHFMVPNGKKCHIVELVITNDALTKNDTASVLVRLQIVVGPGESDILDLQVLEIFHLGAMFQNGMGIPIFSPGSVVTMETRSDRGTGVATTVLASFVWVDTAIYPNA